MLGARLAWRNMDRTIERTVGLVMSLLAGLPAALELRGDRWRLATWTAAFLLFGVLFAFSERGRGLWLPALESLAVMAMVLTRCNGYEGTLLVLVAMHLGTRTAPRWAITWISVQPLVLSAAIAIHWSARPALLLTPPDFGSRL